MMKPINVSEEGVRKNLNNFTSPLLSKENKKNKNIQFFVCFALFAVCCFAWLFHHGIDPESAVGAEITPDMPLTILAFCGDSPGEWWMRDNCNWLHHNFVQNTVNNVELRRYPYLSLPGKLQEAEMDELPKDGRKYILVLTGHGTRGKTDAGSKKLLGGEGSPVNTVTAPETMQIVGQDGGLADSKHRISYASLLASIQKFREKHDHFMLLTDACYSQFITLQDAYIANPFPMIATWALTSGTGKPMTLQRRAVPFDDDDKSQQWRVFQMNIPIMDVLYNELSIHYQKLGQVRDVRSMTKDAEDKVVVPVDGATLVKQKMKRMLSGEKMKMLIYQTDNNYAVRGSTFSWVYMSPKTAYDFASWNIQPRYVTIVVPIQWKDKAACEAETFAIALTNAKYLVGECVPKAEDSTLYKVKGVPESEMSSPAEKLTGKREIQEMPIKSLIYDASTERLTITWDKANCADGFLDAVVKVRWDITCVAGAVPPAPSDRLDDDMKKKKDAFAIMMERYRGWKESQKPAEEPSVEQVPAQVENQDPQVEPKK